MSDKIDDIVVPILRTIQDDIGTLKADVSILKESVQRIDARMASMENFQAGFHNTLNWHGQALDEYRGRLENLEDSQDE